MAPHNQPAMTRRAAAYDPDARAFEVFDLTGRTKLLDPLQATSLDDALAEATQRWGWSRGNRIGIREIGDKVDRLHIYAVRQKSQGNQVWRGQIPATEYRHWLDHICSIDMNIVAGIDVIGVGVERDLFERRQRQRPEGARL